MIADQSESAYEAGADKSCDGSFYGKGKKSVEAVFPVSVAGVHEFGSVDVDEKGHSVLTAEKRRSYRNAYGTEI